MCQQVRSFVYIQVELEQKSSDMEDFSDQFLHKMPRMRDIFANFNIKEYWQHFSFFYFLMNVQIS